MRRLAARIVARVSATGISCVPRCCAGVPAAASLRALHREDASCLREALELALAALPLRSASLWIVSDFFEIDAIEPGAARVRARRVLT